MPQWRRHATSDRSPVSEQPVYSLVNRRQLRRRNIIRAFSQNHVVTVAGLSASTISVIRTVAGTSRRFPRGMRLVSIQTTESPAEKYRRVSPSANTSMSPVRT